MESLSEKIKQNQDINQRFTIIIKGLLILILTIGVISVLSFFGYKAIYSINQNKIQKQNEIEESNNKAKEKQKAEEEAKRLEEIYSELVNIKKVGEKATLENLEIELLEEKKLATLPRLVCYDENHNAIRQPDGKLCLFEKNERNVIGLKFRVTNTANTNQTFNRMSGGLATTDNTNQLIEVYPFAPEEYLQGLGETYTFDNRDLLIKPDETKITWIVIEVETRITNGVFLYPSHEPNSKWEVNNG